MLQSQAVPIISYVCLLDLAPVPTFNLSVDLSTKSLNVTVEPGKAVYARWCYKSNANCMDGSTPVTVRTSRTLIHCHTLWIFLLMSYVSAWSAQIDPSRSTSALVNITYLLPCVCVQVPSVHFFFNADILWILFWWLIFNASTCLLCVARYITSTEIPLEK